MHLQAERKQLSDKMTAVQIDGNSLDALNGELFDLIIVSVSGQVFRLS